MPYIINGGCRLYYEMEGKGQALILIAGYSCDLTMWNLVREYFGKHFQLILLDNRGAGRSDCPDAPYTIDLMSEDVRALIEQLKLHKPHILGHSMGGAIAQTLAMQHPNLVGKVILAQTLIKMPPITGAALQLGIHLRENGVSVRLQAEAIMPWLCSNTFLANPQNCKEFIAVQEAAPYPSSLIGLKRQLQALRQFDSTHWFAKITAPTLILYGEEDLLCSPAESKKLASGIPRAKLHPFPHLGHLAPIERAEEFSKVVTSFNRE